jgi:hypothetical protein
MKIAQTEFLDASATPGPGDCKSVFAASNYAAGGFFKPAHRQLAAS